MMATHARECVHMRANIVLLFAAAPGVLNDAYHTGPARIKMILLLLTCTYLKCVGIHPVRIEPASPTALTTSRTEALQTRRSCASSLDTFTQSFLQRAWL